MGTLSVEEIQAYVLGKFSGKGEDFVKQLTEIPWRRQVSFSRVTFGEFDFFLVVRASGLKNLQDFILNHLRARDDVSETLTLLPFEFSMQRIEDKMKGKEIALVLGKARTSDMANVMKALREMEQKNEILKSEDILGPYDFLVLLDLKGGFRDVGEFVRKRIRSVEGIERTMTLLCYSAGS